MLTIYTRVGGGGSLAGSHRSRIIECMICWQGEAGQVIACVLYSLSSGRKGQMLLLLLVIGKWNGKEWNTIYFTNTKQDWQLN